MKVQISSTWSIPDVSLNGFLQIASFLAFVSSDVRGSASWMDAAVLLPAGQGGVGKVNLLFQKDKDKDKDRKMPQYYFQPDKEELGEG